MAHLTRFTVLGSTGFIGHHLVTHLRACGYEVLTPGRDTDLIGHVLGHVIYAVGLTGDFRQRPFDTVDAHVGLLSRLLQLASFDSFLYLSSTRVYGGLAPDRLAQEEMALPQQSTIDGLYDLSKMLGEALCLALPNSAIRVVRLSNVYGLGQSPHTFLHMLLAELQCNAEVVISEAAESTKDYVAVADVVELLPQISLSGRKRLYNLASGRNLSHRELADCLQALTGCAVRFAHGVRKRSFPRIDVTRVTSEFYWCPRNLLLDLPKLLSVHCNNIMKKD